MTGFLGEYEVTIDAKGRFLVPVALKKQLAEEGAHQFVINRGLDFCLSLYPMESWDPLYTKISKLNDFDIKASAFKRRFLNGASKIELDSAGRLLLPKNLMEYAQLEKDAVLVFVGDKIEIWDKIKYKEFFESFSQEEFKIMANEVMGSKSDS
jgi:MraZ protein